MYILKFIENCKTKREFRRFLGLTVDEISTANIRWIKDVQRPRFQDEIKCLQNSSKKSSIIRQLGLYLDNGLLCCGGRLDNSTLSVSAKHSYILPTKHCYTT